MGNVELNPSNTAEVRVGEPHLIRYTDSGVKTNSIHVKQANGNVEFNNPDGSPVKANSKAILAGAPFVAKAALGHNGAGAVTLTGTKVGDTVVSATNLSTPGDVTSSFESTITVAGQIQQSAATDLSAAQILFFVVNQS